MNSIFGSFRPFLSKKGAVIFLFIVALGCRLENALFNNDLNSDKQTQMIAAQSFLDGKGIRLPQAKLSDISQIEFKDYYQWPKGYSVYFAGIFFFCRNFFWASVILDALVITLYFLSWRRLINGFSEKVQDGNVVFSIFLILAAFSNMPFTYLKSSDLIAISFYLFSLSCLYKSTDSRKDWLLYFVGLAGICLSIYTRYAYIPVAYCLLAGFFLLFYKNRKRLFILRFFIGFVFVSIFVILTNHSDESPAFVNEAGKAGYHLGALSKFNFMFLNQAFFPDNILHSVTKLLKNRYLMISFLTVLSLLILFIFFGSLRKLIAGYLKDSTISSTSEIILSSFASAVVSVLLLIYMSLTRPIQNNDILDNWTYVEEERYYVIVWMTILMSFLVVILYDRGMLKKITLWFFLIAFLIQVPYFFYNKYTLIRNNNTYFMTGEKKIYFPKFPRNSQERDQIIKDYAVLNKLIDSLERKNGIKPVYLSADRSERFAVLNGAVFGLQEMLTKNIYAGRNQSLIIKLSDDDLYPNQKLKDFVNTNKIEGFYSGRIGTLYTCAIMHHNIGR